MPANGTDSAMPVPIKSDLRRALSRRISKQEYDEAPELTAEMLDRAQAFLGDRYLGPARAVAANGGRPVVDAREQQRTAEEVLRNAL
jgi:hypothetical protein